MQSTTLILFEHESLGDVYLWNGDYPVHILPYLSSTLWTPNGDISQKEHELFKSLETSKKRGFELKDRGRFNILQRIPVAYDKD
jgi:hypothetical protein